MTEYNDSSVRSSRRRFPVVLPERRLLRHVTWSLPPGQRMAQAIGVSVLSREDLADVQPFGFGLNRSTPLGFCILGEADLIADGRQLAGVGARIVGEVVLGLLQTDPDSFVVAQPRWATDVAGAVQRPRRLSNGRLPRLRGGRSAKPRSVAVPVR